MAISPLPGGAARTHGTNTRKKRIAGEKFIFDVELGGRVGWSLISSIERYVYTILLALVHAQIPEGCYLAAVASLQ